MSLLRRSLPLIFLIAAVYIWYFAAHIVPAAAPVKVLTAGGNVSLFVEPSSGKDPIISQINAAQKEILVEVYLLSDKDVIKALEDARKRGVSVKVMMEEHPFGGGNLNPTTKKELETSNIQVNWTNPDFALTHEKTITIDGREVFVLNQNLTASAFSKNREYDIFDTNTVDANIIRTIFYDDWQRKNYSPPDQTDLVISPLTSRKILTALISKSQKSLDIEVEDIDDASVVAAISQDAQHEKVRIITPSLSQISSNSKALQTLKSNNVEVKYLSSPYIHAKLILSDDQTAYIGSINLSSQSMDENREVGIIISNLEIINTLSQTFESDWEKAKELN